MLAANPGMRLAVLIDGDNVASKNADAIFARLAGLGETPIRRLYGNLVDSTTRDWQPAIGRHAITARQQIPLTPLKNAADIALAVDAMDILHAGGIDGFCIVSSDCDFTPLAIRLREAGKIVYGFGRTGAQASYKASCTAFFHLGAELAPKQPLPPKPPKLTMTEADIRRIAETFDARKNADGWIELATFGQELRKLDPKIKAKHYGHSTLSKLLHAVGDFDIRSNGAGGFEVHRNEE